MWAAELTRPRSLVNSICPGWGATDMGGAGRRPVADGADRVGRRAARRPAEAAVSFGTADRSPGSRTGVPGGSGGHRVQVLGGDHLERLAQRGDAVGAKALTPVALEIID
jgi:NAD(P)-dependent dehydrogenase (short-subunit alcohol dehydrogenase family)